MWYSPNAEQSLKAYTALRAAVSAAATWLWLLLLLLLSLKWFAFASAADDHQALRQAQRAQPHFHETDQSEKSAVRGGVNMLVL